MNRVGRSPVCGGSRRRLKATNSDYTSPYGEAISGHRSRSPIS